MALLLRLRTTTATIQNPLLLRHHRFSTSNSGNGDKPPSNSNSPFSSLFGELKSTLKQPKSPSSNPTPSFAASSSNNSQQSRSLDEIVTNIKEFRIRNSVPPPPQQKPISFQAIYNEMQKRDGGGGGDSGGSEPTRPRGGGLGMAEIRRSLQNIRDGGGGDRMSSPGLRDLLRSKPSPVIGGTSVLPESVFGREMLERRGGGDGLATAVAGRTELFTSYTPQELGEKLRGLRPQVKGKDWFSIAELNERLMKVREMDDLEAKKNPTGSLVSTIRHAVGEIEDQKSKKTSLQRIDMLSLLGGTPTYLLKPPKEHLVEKYFHPDNMSSAEKMKIELAKVRDEFKMSESDCGSARVQVAQLTTKIKHLSSVLHKKDVHSRKGLIAMVQKRKRLLKYLRRTDWDSYCFVISKLGLRDNPDHSNKIRSKSRSGEMAS